MGMTRADKKENMREVLGGKDSFAGGGRMKKILAAGIIIAAIAWAGLLPAQEAKGPKIVATEVQYDFGKVVQGTLVSHVFQIRNEGSAPLDIERVQSS